LWHHARVSSARALAPAGAFFLAVLLFLGVQASFTGLLDGDSYYHLAVARHYAERGIRETPPWPRFSALADGFGDKELLFHVALRPFAGDPDIERGKWALAAMNGVVAAALAAAAVRRLGLAAIVVPFACLALSFDYAGRAFRLRPELLSLFGLVVATELAARGRHRAVGLVAAVLALSHGGFHALVVLGVLWTVADRARGLGWNGRGLAWIAAGTAAGVLVHPHFPANLEIWWLQFGVHPFIDLPDKGGEFAKTQLVDLVRQNGAWLAALLGLASLSAARAAGPPPDALDRALARHHAVAAALFALAWIVDLPRYALWAVPFTTLATLHALGGRGARPPAWRTAVGAAALLAAAVLATAQLGRLAAMLHASGVHQPGRVAAERAFARHVPAGARVAATWAEAEVYVYWAPQARYLNLLDPVFMAAPYPAEYRRSLRLFAGEEPDLPLALFALDSDHLALRRVRGRPILAQLEDDPRIAPVHVGMDALYRLRRGANAGFLLDWHRVDVGSRRRYPRLLPSAGGDVEGFVDAARSGALDADGCARFVRETTVAAPVETELELSGLGATVMRIDGAPVPRDAATEGAVLGRGARVAVRWAPGTHRIEVVTCRAGAHAGFYLLDRGARPPLAP
jgi:hypothetical protein